MRSVDPISQKEFTLQIMLIAAIRSFIEDSELHFSQFLLRRFTPNQTLCSKYVVELVHKGLLQADISNVVLPLPNQEGTSSIKLSIPRQSKQLYQSLELGVLREKITLSSPLAKGVAQLIQHITISELIEYTSIYAAKFGIHVHNIEINQPKLLMIVHECRLNQAFMLAWRTLKKFSEESPGQMLDFSEFSNQAYQFFLGYRRQDVEIKCYARPIELKITQIQYLIYRDLLQVGENESEIIEFLTSVNLSEQLRLLANHGTYDSN